MVSVNDLSDNNLRHEDCVLKVIAIIVSEPNPVLFLAVFNDFFFQVGNLVPLMLRLEPSTEKEATDKREHYVVVIYGEISIFWS